ADGADQQFQQNQEPIEQFSVLPLLTASPFHLFFLCCGSAPGAEKAVVLGPRHVPAPATPGHAGSSRTRTRPGPGPGRFTTVREPAGCAGSRTALAGRVPGTRRRRRNGV